MLLCDLGFDVYHISRGRVWDSSFRWYNNEVFLIVTVQMERYQTKPRVPSVSGIW